jgi:membrane-bound metal-dependent hydrolase YbcI (DUF457 family)
MPVLGHAFCGWATAITVPATAPDAEQSHAPAAAALWGPMLIGMAYLPDLVGTLGETAGYPAARQLGHSLLVAPLAALGLAPLLAAFPFGTRRRAFALTLFSILLHDALDLLQSTDRMPFWPLSERLVRLATPLVPSGARAEAVAFGLAFLVFLALRHRFTRASAAGAALPRGPALASWLLVALVMSGATGLHLLRRAREDALGHAHSLLSQRRYRDALETLEAANRWPGVREPGRVDHLRGRAWEGLGDVRRAEALLLRALQADPGHFWALVDLAELYATTDRPASERRAQLEPYLDRLRTEFAGDPHLPRVLAAIEDEFSKPRAAGR